MAVRPSQLPSRCGTSGRPCRSTALEMCPSPARPAYQLTATDRAMSVGFQARTRAIWTVVTTDQPNPQQNNVRASPGREELVIPAKTRDVAHNAVPQTSIERPRPASYNPPIGSRKTRAMRAMRDTAIPTTASPNPTSMARKGERSVVNELWTTATMKPMRRRQVTESETCRGQACASFCASRGQAFARNGLITR
jgi:hypothetical protein